jgi:hypothetical protein
MAFLVYVVHLAVRKTWVKNENHGATVGVGCMIEHRRNIK